MLAPVDCQGVTLCRFCDCQPVKPDMGLHVSKSDRFEPKRLCCALEGEARLPPGRTYNSELVSGRTSIGNICL
jgi:hypothetical protein